jgi:TonB family protein
MSRVLCRYVAVALFAIPAVAHATTQRAVYAPPPRYPAEAKARHLTGSGVIALHIRPEGAVEQVETVKSIGHPLLDQAAIAAFSEWRFHPSEAAWVLRIPIRYVNGPKRIDSSMLQSPAPGWGMLVTVFSGAKS